MDGSYVGKPCPKCKYVRAVHESAPEWQCPKCGIAYAKFLQARSAPEAGPDVRLDAGVAAAHRPAGQSYTLAVVAHLSIPLGFFIPLFNLIVPIVIWQTKKNEDEFAVAAAKEALNFQISMLLWWLGVLLGAVVAGIAAPPLIYAVILLAVAIFLASLILPIIAAVKVGSGDSYTYPFIKHYFE